jgi:membrane dipeptidase
LTHACDNPFATSCSTVAAGKPDLGLTEIGRHAVREMNRLGIFKLEHRVNLLGMLVDLSHVSVQTMHDTISLSLAPPIFSHSSAYTIHNHERNVPDSVLERLRSTDGVVMINFYKGFISGEKKCTVDNVARHILHVARVAGWR